ncbi:type VI secretion system Vgr family protein [Legionella sp. WA2024007413]
MKTQIVMPQLEIPGVNASEIIVLEFEGRQAISELYQFDIEFVSKSVIRAKQVINQKAHLLFAKKISGTTPLNGEIVSFSHLDAIDQYQRYKIKLMPKVHRLQHIKQNEIFLQQSIPQIIKSILDKNGITQVELDIMMEHQPKAFIFQYNETDWNFISRWMEREGLIYYFSQDKSGEKLVITDSNSTLKNNQDISILYYQAYTPLSEKNPTCNLVYNIQLTTQVLPQKVTVKSYNHAQSSKPYTSKAMIDELGYGEVVFWAENVKSNKENQRIANFISESYKCKKEILTGVSSGSLIIPGTIIQHQNFRIHPLNIPMLIIESTYRGSQKKSFLSLHSGEVHSPEDYFKCEYRAIDKSVAYRSTIQDYIPRINGLFPAFIDHEGNDDTVQINKKGMYKFRFAMRDDNPGKGSAWVRKMESYLGDQYAFNLPLRKGNEVVIGFQFGNPDLPIILGTISNSTHRNIITANSQNYMGLYTKENNVFIINERDGKTKGMQFSTTNNNTTMVLGTDNIFNSQLDAGYCLRTDNSVCQTVGKNAITDIADHSALTVGGNHLVTVKGTSSNTIYGADYYSCFGARSSSVLGLDFISRAGAMIDTTSGFQVKLGSGWRYEQDSSTNLKTAPVIMQEAEVSISLTVGESSITITEEGITITAPTIDLVSEAAITLTTDATINLASTDVNIMGTISGGPMAELGVGGGELAVPAQLAALAQALEEAGLNTAQSVPLIGGAMAAWGSAKHAFTVATDTLVDLGSALKSEVEPLIGKASALVEKLEPVTEKIETGVEKVKGGIATVKKAAIYPALSYGGYFTSLATKSQLLSQGLEVPKYEAEFDED